MAASQARIALRVFFAAALLLAAYYIGRPLYWKISATVHEIRERRQTVRQGLSEIMLEAQRSVGWIHGLDQKDAKAATRRLLREELLTATQSLANKGLAG